MMLNSKYCITLIILILSTLAPQLVFADQTIQRENYTVIIKSGDHVIVKNKSGAIEQESWFKTNGFNLKQAMDFLQKLKKLIKDGEKHSIANLINYKHPFRTNKIKTPIKNQTEFLRNYSTIMTPDVRKAILQQDPYTLFANSKGIMIGNGDVWINHCSLKGKLCIISINSTLK